jgi:hypothetical protein
VTGAAAGLSAGADGQISTQRSEEEKKLDRQRVIASGMTEAEAECWEAVAEAASKFFRLPKLHPMDDDEVARAIHIIQNKLLSRPTYRKYQEMSKVLKK